MKKQLLSVVISAYNEEVKIEDCLRSVQFADEIIFVDNESTDDTIEIAKKYTNKIYTRPNNPMLNVNKNYGFTKAAGDWILSLDADERVTPELAKEISHLIEVNGRGDKLNGYFLPRKNIIFGKWIKHTGWYPDHQLRLFRHGFGKFPEKHVHEMIQADGLTEYLKEHIVHYNYDSVLQFLQKLGAIYAPNEADQLIESGYSFDWKDTIRLPAKEFISRYFAREGYKDGLHGLILSLLMAFYHFIVFVNIWERQGFKQIDDNILNDTQQEFKKFNKELMFWFANEKIKNSQNRLKKIWLRGKQRLI